MTSNEILHKTLMGYIANSFKFGFFAASVGSRGCLCSQAVNNNFIHLKLGSEYPAQVALEPKFHFLKRILTNFSERQNQPGSVHSKEKCCACYSCTDYILYKHFEL